MKRDMELVRRILLDMESSKSEFGVCDVIPSYEYEDVAKVIRHIGLMVDAGLLNGIVLEEDADRSICILGDTQPKISWEGYEFLDSIRDDGIWKQTKEAITSQVGAASVAVMIMVAKDIAKEALGIK